MSVRTSAPAARRQKAVVPVVWSGSTRLLGRLQGSLNAKMVAKLLHANLPWDGVIVPVGRSGLSIEQGEELGHLLRRTVVRSPLIEWTFSEGREIQEGRVRMTPWWTGAFLNSELTRLASSDATWLTDGMPLWLSADALDAEALLRLVGRGLPISAIVVNGSQTTAVKPEALQALYRARQWGWPVAYLCDLGTAEENKTALSMAPGTLIVSFGSASHQTLEQRMNELEAYQRSLSSSPAWPTPDVLQREEATRVTLVAARPVRRGEPITERLLRKTDGGPGVSATLWDDLLNGAIALYDLQEGEPITCGLIDLPPTAAQPGEAAPRVSVVLRTKNEARWIKRCISAIRHQQGAGQVEIILVDHESTDGTPEIATRLGCRIVPIGDDRFSYGAALNLGIEKSCGEYVALLSAHCIPVNDQWLLRLLANFHVPATAGVYGRQEPLPDSHDFDKRDLWTTFGLTRRVQRGEDYFFHNANSMIRKAAWSARRFDESLRGVEDRAWAKHVLRTGHQVVYEPAASVYHYHGIHQGRDEQRAERVVKVIELIHRSH